MILKTANVRLWILAFILGTLSPVLTLLFKPDGYGFYMSHPASPHTLVGRVGLAIANGILVGGFLVCCVAVVFLAYAAIKHRKFAYAFCCPVLFFNPFHQPVFLESLDTHMNYQWRDRADELQIVGKTPEEVRRLFGTPDREWTGETYTGWEYKPLPFCWIGSRFQIFFIDGVVRNYKANDD